MFYSYKNDLITTKEQLKERYGFEEVEVIYLGEILDHYLYTKRFYIVEDLREYLLLINNSSQQFESEDTMFSLPRDLIGDFYLHYQMLIKFELKGILERVGNSFVIIEKDLINEELIRELRV